MPHRSARQDQRRWCSPQALTFCLWSRGLVLDPREMYFFNGQDALDLAARSPAQMFQRDSRRQHVPTSLLLQVCCQGDARRTVMSERCLLCCLQVQPMADHLGFFEGTVEKMGCSDACLSDLSLTPRGLREMCDAGAAEAPESSQQWLRRVRGADGTDLGGHFLTTQLSPLT